MTVTTFRCIQQMGRCQGWGWHVQAHHEDGGGHWEEHHCPWFPTRAEARAAAEALVIQELEAEARAVATEARGRYIQRLQAEARAAAAEALAHLEES